MLLAAAACTERIGELDPRPGISNFFFATHLEGREPPPGLDQAWPNLSSVPDRPTPPDATTRERLSAGLAADRERSRTPLAAGTAPGPSAGPPAPPRFAAVPVIPFETPAPPQPVARPVPAPQPAPAPSPAPAAAPEPPAPPPAPSRDLFAPPPPPSRDLLAPRGG